MGTRAFKRIGVNFDMFQLKWMAFAGLTWFACVGCDDCESVTQDANEYVNDSANRVCVIDADCVAVSTGCMSLQRGYCGQVALSKTSAKSSTWTKILEESHDNCDSSCGQCLALLIPTCKSGLCGGP
jgi:hypothetical protein